jgi:hypothetical protein
MTVVGFSNVGCSGGIGSHSVNPSQCYPSASASHEISLPGPTQGCALGTVTPTISSTSWTVDRLACTATSGGTCTDSSETCVPQPAAPFQAAVCVLQAGDHACPASYPNRTDYFQSVTDSRACPGTCSCDASGAHCSVELTTYSDSSCATQYGTHTLTSSASWCYGGAINSIEPGSVGVGGTATCTPTDPALTGSATASDPVTVCCM